MNDAASNFVIWPTTNDTLVTSFSIPRRSIRFTLAALLPLALAACQSNQASKTLPSQTPAAVATAENPLPPNFKFSFYISGTGDEDVSDTGTKPYDSWTMDTTGEMNVRVSRRTARANFDNQSGLAALDKPDMDSLRFFIRTG